MIRSDFIPVVSRTKLKTKQQQRQQQRQKIGVATSLPPTNEGQKYRDCLPLRKYLQIGD